MLASLLSIIQDMYDTNDNILKDGENARVRPNTGVKQGCPLSPLRSSLYINDASPPLVI